MRVGPAIGWCGHLTRTVRRHWAIAPCGFRSEGDAYPEYMITISETLHLMP